MLPDPNDRPGRPSRLLGLTNSLRPGSLNHQALLLVQECLPRHMTLDLHDLRSIPLFDVDLEAAGCPPAVQDLGTAVAMSDGVVLCSPEYNHSIPPIVKNAIDWCSRLADRPMCDKPVMLLSATPGLLGGARVQYELRRVLDAVCAATMVRPEVFIGRADHKFDAAGRCTDEPTRAAVRQQLAAFDDWMQRTRRAVRSGAEQA